ncbi:hypothetical protein CLF_105763 [Clonorchis sinensis]|uniref:Uncharacterized protein n=1 Tax=Clonorchis sinensis TaxID=79923 RepID=G7YE61_CLOSI|nr:hypothetical protein CLF_105763 [Clonorchis sinensis]
MNGRFRRLPDEVEVFSQCWSDLFACIRDKETDPVNWRRVGDTANYQKRCPWLPNEPHRGACNRQRLFIFDGLERYQTVDSQWLGLLFYQRRQFSEPRYRLSQLRQTERSNLLKCKGEDVGAQFYLEDIKSESAVHEQRCGSVESTAFLGVSEPNTTSLLEGRLIADLQSAIGHYTMLSTSLSELDNTEFSARLQSPSAAGESQTWTSGDAFRPATSDRSELTKHAVIFDGIVDRVKSYGSLVHGLQHHSTDFWSDGNSWYDGVFCFQLMGSLSASCGPFILHYARLKALQDIAANRSAREWFQFGKAFHESIAMQHCIDISTQNMYQTQKRSSAYRSIVSGYNAGVKVNLSCVSSGYPNECGDCTNRSQPIWTTKHSHNKMLENYQDAREIRTHNLPASVFILDLPTCYERLIITLTNAQSCLFCLPSNSNRAQSLDHVQCGFIVSTRQLAGKH